MLHLQLMLSLVVYEVYASAKMRGRIGELIGKEEVKVKVFSARKLRWVEQKKEPKVKKPPALGRVRGGRGKDEDEGGGGTH